METRGAEMTTVFFFVLTGLFLLGARIAFCFLGSRALIAVGAFLLVIGAAVFANTAVVFLGIAVSSTYLLFDPASN